MNHATPQGALALAAWLRTYHGPLYARLATLAGTKLGCVACDSKGLGALGQDVPLDISTIDPSIALDTIDPSTFAPITIDAGSSLPDIVAASDASSTAADLVPASSSSPSWLSSTLSSVGNFLTTGGGIASALNLGTALVQNQTQRAVLGVQMARVSAGYNPAAIGYTTNRVTGQATPYLQSTYPGIAYPATPSLLSSLTPSYGMSQFLSTYGIWLAAAAGLLLIVSIARR